MSDTWARRSILLSSQRSFRGQVQFGAALRILDQGGSQGRRRQSPERQRHELELGAAAQADGLSVQDGVDMAVLGRDGPGAHTLDLYGGVLAPVADDLAEQGVQAEPHRVGGA